MIVFPAPVVEFFLRIFQWQEPVNVQSFIPQTAVKWFNKRVICRLSGVREVHCDAVFIRPFIQTFWDKLAAVIRLDSYRQPLIQHPQCLHYSDHILAFLWFSGMDRQAFPTKIIHYSQRPKTPPVKQIIWHKIHTPALIDMRQDRALLTACCTDMSAGAFSAQVQAFRTINPVGFLWLTGHPSRRNWIWIRGQP